MDPLRHLAPLQQEADMSRSRKTKDQVKVPISPFHEHLALLSRREVEFSVLNTFNKAFRLGQRR